MSRLVQKLKELPTYLQALIAIIVVVALLGGIAVIISSVFLSFGSPPPEYPMVDFEYDYNNQTNELTITHSGGEEIQADAIELVVNDETRRWTETSTIETGNSTTLDGIRSGDVIHIVWRNNGNRHTLDRYTVE